MHIVTINMNTCCHYEHDDKWSLRTRLPVVTMVMNTKSHLNMNITTCCDLKHEQEYM